MLKTSYAYMHLFIFPYVKVYQTLTASVYSHTGNVTKLRDQIDRSMIFAMIPSIDSHNTLYVRKGMGLTISQTKGH